MRQMVEEALCARLELPAPGCDPMTGKSPACCTLYTWLIIFWLLLPILVIILFGFNNTTGKFNFIWQGFTLHWYRDLFDIPDLTTALGNSITIALIVTVVSALMGTMMGFALGM